MRWRLSKLNWAYAVGELLIVVVGVLTALAVDQWNNDRLDRQQELDIVGRLIIDLKSDLRDLADELQGLEKKQASLLRVRSALASDVIPIESAAAFLRDVVDGANYGWNQFEARRITIDELLATGKLGLLRDASLREQIAEYYEGDRGTHQRIDERETDYPAISYRLVDRANEGTSAGDADIIELAIDDDRLAQAVERVLVSPLIEHVGAELNFARFVRSVATRQQDEARELAGALEAYLDDVE